MKLEDAIEPLKKIKGVPFSELYSTIELKDIIKAKGNTGKLLEKIIGLPPGNTLKDFENGELKTNKSDSNGNPLETMFISQISLRIDDLINNSNFYDSWVYEKIKRLLYVPVVKTDKDPNKWYFLECKFVDIEKNKALCSQLETDFKQINAKINSDLNIGDKFLHTSSGKYIQIRTKDAKPYNPIYSNVHNRKISNKNFAFYFQKEFMRDIQSGQIK
jgi:DNA mismatch repair protein MutH